MTKKDYVLIADALVYAAALSQKYDFDGERTFLAVVDTLAGDLAKDNPRFSKATFKKYITERL